MSVAIAVRTSEGILVFADSVSLETETGVRRNDAEKLFIFRKAEPVAFYAGGLAILNETQISDYLAEVCGDGFHFNQLADALRDAWAEDYAKDGKPDEKYLDQEQIDLIAVTTSNEFYYAKFFPLKAEGEKVDEPRNVIAMGCVKAYSAKWAEEFDGDMRAAIESYGPVFDNICTTDNRCGYPGKLLRWRHHSEPQICTFADLAALKDLM